MIAFRTNLNQLDKICRRLDPKVSLANSRERIRHHDLGESVQRRFSTRHERDFRFEKKVEFTGERSFGAACAFGYCLNAAQRLSAPRNDQAGITELAFAKKNRRSGLHGKNLARDRRNCRASASLADLPHALGQIRFSETD
jgi:hypothetical protein